MNVNLTPELAKLVQEKVRSGLYNNQSEVVREALRLLAAQDREREVRLRGLRDAVAEGLTQADRGDLYGAEVIEDLRGWLRDRRSKKKRE